MGVKRERSTDYGLKSNMFSPKKRLNRQRSSALYESKKKKVELNQNFINQRSSNQQNQKERNSLHSSNKTFQRKETEKPKTKKTLNRIREKLQTQC